MFFRIFLCAFLCNLLVFRVLAQDPWMYFRVEKDGQTLNQVTGVYQDPQTFFLWLTVHHHLIRFDGGKFKTVFSHSIPEARLQDVHVDGRKRLWCLSNLGELLFLANLRTKPLVLHKVQRPQGEMQRLHLDSQQRLWLLQRDELRLYDVSQDSIKLLWTQPLDLVDTSLAYYRGRLYCWTSQGLSAFAADATVAHYPFEGAKPQANLFFQKDQDLYVYCKATRKIYAVAEQGLVSWGQLPSLNAPALCVHWMDDQLGVGTKKGLALFTWTGKDWQARRVWYQHYIIKQILLDHEGNYWLNVQGQGLAMIPSTAILHYNHLNSFLDQPMVNYLAKGQKHLYLALENGKIYQTDLEQQHRLIYTSPDSTPNIQIMRYDTAHEMLCFADDKLWVYHQAKIKVLSSDFAHHLRDWVVLAPNVHLLAHAQGLDLLSLGALPDSLREWLPAHQADKNQQTIFDQEGVQQCLYLPQHKTLWLVTTQGQLFYLQNRAWKQILFPQKDVFVRNICTDQEQIYVGTAAHGFLAFSTQGRYLDANADWAIGNNMLHLFCAQDGVLWYKIEQQLVGVDPINQWFWTYDAYDGLSLDQINDFNQFGPWLVLATNSGLITFPQKRSFKYQAPIPIYLEELISNQDTFLSLPTTTLQGAVPHRIELKIGGISYRSRGQFYSYYKLSGSDMSNDEYVGTQREFVQQFNREGLYALEAKIRNGNYAYSLLYPIQIEVNLSWIQKPENIIYVILFLIVFLLIIGYYLLYMNNQNQQLRKESTISRLDTIRAQMNPHFVFNSLNTIQNYIYNNDKDKAIFFLGRFSSLMREVLDMSTQKQISLEVELKHLQDYLQLEQMRFGGALEYQIELDPDLDTNYLTVPPMLIQPYVENAIKHGLWHKKEGQKLLQIRFYAISEAKIGVEILDNGIGRKKSQEIQKNQPQNHKSYASQATKNRIDLLNEVDQKKSDKFVLKIEDLTDNQGQPLGTKVILTIPIQYI